MKRKMEKLSLNSDLEIWKDVPGFEGLYQVSNLGRIKRLATTTVKIFTTEVINEAGQYCSITRRRKEIEIKERILNPVKSPGFYLAATLCKRNITTQVLLHRLVANLFVPNPDNLPIVNHINNNKHDARAINLEWCTQLHNVRHAISIGKAPKKPYNNTHAVKPINQYDLEGNLIKTWPSIVSISRETNFNKVYISYVLRQAPEREAYGFRWKYSEAI
jgi:hypothetical protein